MNDLDFERRRIFSMWFSRPVGIALTLTASAIAFPALSAPKSPGDHPNDQTTAFSNYVSDDGEIRLPKDFRTRFVHLGSFFVPEEPGAAGPGLHDVYTQRATVKAYRETGQFPDGAVLVKEVRHTDSEPLATGTAHWGTDVGVWFVMVRDRKDRFPDHPNFGGGWAWGLFKPDAPDTNVATSWKGEGFSNCYGCHLPAKKTDWVYVQGYPTLK
ncbi:MAG: cytochrome P460 family protein [Gammaproteobacteria bacterium]